MGKKQDAKSALTVIERTIYDLEQRIAELKQEGDPESGKRPERVKQELDTLTRQLDYARMTKLRIEEEMQKIKKEEERKQIEKLLKCCMVMGAITENLRIRDARERDFMQRTSDVLLTLSEAADELFRNEDFRFVTREDVDAIMEDQEFQEMAAEDPNRLEREEEDMRAEYERMIEQALLLHSKKPVAGDFAANQKMYHDSLKEENGFEEALRRSEDYIKETIPTIGSPEDVQFFMEVLKETTELAAITRHLQDEFLEGKSSFEKGNGYTKELIEREKQLVKKLTDYGEEKMSGEHGFMNMDQETPEAQNVMKLFERSQMMLTPIRLQSQRDAVLQNNNRHRERKERWTVYHHLATVRDGEIPEIPEAEDNRRKAWAMVRRVERLAVRNSIAPNVELTEELFNERKKQMKEGRFGLLERTAIQAAAEIQTLLEMISDQKRQGELTKDTLREKLAAMVLFQIVSDEMKRPNDEPRPYYEELRKRKNQFRKIAKELADTKEFKDAMKNHFHSKTLKEDCLRFLADDHIKTVALQLGGMKRKPEPQAAPNRGK